MNRLILSAVLALLPLGAVAAPVSDADKAAIQARIDDFDAIMRAGQLEKTLDFVAPEVLASMAQQAGMTTEQLRTVTTEQMKPMLEAVKIEDFSMDLAGATFAETPDGSRGYALIPTVTVMDVKDQGKMRGTSQTLAMESGGEWRLMRIDDAGQVGILRKVFPEFEGVEFPTGSIAAVE